MKKTYEWYKKDVIKFKMTRTTLVRVIYFYDKIYLEFCKINYKREGLCIK